MQLGTYIEASQSLRISLDLLGSDKLNITSFGNSLLWKTPKSDASAHILDFRRFNIKMGVQKCCQIKKRFKLETSFEILCHVINLPWVCGAMIRHKSRRYSCDLNLAVAKASLCLFLRLATDAENFMLACLISNLNLNQGQL